MCRKAIMGAVFFIGLILTPLSGISSVRTVGENGAIAKEVHAAQLNTVQLNKTDAANQIDAFMRTMKQSTDKDGKVLHMKSKADLLDQFNDIADRQAAAPFINELYQEEKGSVYLKSTEWPPSFDKQADYDVVQLSKGKAEVNQHLNSALYGDLTITIQFEYDDKWKISQIVYR